MCMHMLCACICYVMHKVHTRCTSAWHALRIVHCTYSCTVTAHIRAPTLHLHTLHTRGTHAAHTLHIHCTQRACPYQQQHQFISNNNSHPTCRYRGGGASSTRCSLPACRRVGASSMPPPRYLLGLLGLGLARGRVCTSGSRATASSYRRVKKMNAGVEHGSALLRKLRSVCSISS